jgi:hypothetical protein
MQIAQSQPINGSLTKQTEVGAIPFTSNESWSSGELYETISASNPSTLIIPHHSGSVRISFYRAYRFTKLHGLQLKDALFSRM